MVSYKYRDRGTSIYRLNSWCKLTWMGSIVILALVFDNPFYLLLLFLATLPMVLSAKVMREWASLMKFSLFLGLMIIVMNALLSNRGMDVLWQSPVSLPLMGTIRITLQAIVYGIGQSLRLMTILSAFTLLIFTIEPDDLLLSMRKLKLPYKAVLVFSLATRFVPVLMNDAQTIIDVQRCRGVEFDRGKWFSRVKKYVMVMVPLLSNSLDRGVQVAEAMESRAFGSGQDRSFYREVQITSSDKMILAAAALPCFTGIYMCYLGQGEYDYYPILGSLSLSSFEVVMVLVLMLLLNLGFFLMYLRRKVLIDQD
ncbi:MAG: energy-coupling factor transporter transmembrane protein EcfT [Dehalococcoidia bacterium]|nr:energy-coupling factor transporter transmembrane protein EcfT [Dehalococcoidia bacterium]